MSATVSPLVALRDACRPFVSPMRVGCADRGRFAVCLGSVLVLFGCVIVTPWLATAEAVAASGGSIQQVPDPAVKTSNVIAAMSCPSATVCIAVGSSLNKAGTVKALTERWNGTRWSVQRTPTPRGTTFSELAGISCPSATVCIAVGDYTNRAGTAAPLVERWNSASWSIQRTNGAGGGFFVGVSCTSATACTAVGDTTNRANVTVTLAERWDGTRWSVQPTQSPHGAISSQLAGVSCPSATMCIAVGSFMNRGGASSMLAEGWNGANWSIQRTAKPAGAKESELVDVSCSSATACTASGDYSNQAGTGAALTEGWNGSSWSVEPTTDPASAKDPGLTQHVVNFADDSTAVAFNPRRAGGSG